MLRWSLLAALALLVAACGQSGGNPFAATSPSRPPGPNVALVFVSGSWSADPGQPRELMGIGLDGSLERLTTCAREATPCDILQAAPSPDRNRVIVVRTTPNAEAGASFLYFMDLSRSVQQLLFPKRRIESADWSTDGSFLLYASAFGQTNDEDLFTAGPDGTNEQNVTNTVSVRERFGRIDPFGRTAIYEHLDADGVSRVYIFLETPVTSGPAAGPGLPGTPYLVGSDASPTFSPDATRIVFRRLTGTGNGGLGTWDLITLPLTTGAAETRLVSGPLYRGAPDWGPSGLVFVETDAAAGTSQLVLIQPDGTGRTVLRTEPAGFRMGAPRWLP